MALLPESEFNVISITSYISFETQFYKLVLFSIYLFSIAWMHLKMHQAKIKFFIHYSVQLFKTLGYAT